MIPFKKLNWKKSEVWVTSDIHYDHKGICKGVSQWADDDCRNFNTLEEMNDALVNGINRCVMENDLLISHGDWSFNGEANIEILRNRINCKNIIYIRGNHCQHVHKHPELFMEILDIGFFQVENMKFVSCHYPIHHWHFQEKGSYMLHGHLHGKEDIILKQMHDGYRIMDVGVDCAYNMLGEYAPLSLLEVESLLETNKKLHRHEGDC